MPPENAAQSIILLAEDDPNVRETTTDLLSLTGAVILATCSGREASRVLETQKVDLIITDMIMPDGDGKWLINFVRSTPALRHLRIILLSARADETDIRAGLGAGADLYLTKPFDPEKLLETVAYWLQQPPRTEPDGLASR